MKKFLSFLFVLFFGLVLVACAGPTTDDRLVVTFWHAMGTENQGYIAEMIETFEAKYPNVRVDQASQGGYNELLDKVKNNIKAGTTPTIAQTYPDHVTSYLTSKNAVVDLNNYAYDAELGFDAQGIDPTIYVDTFYNESFSYDKEGSMYSMPFNKSTEIVFYNQDIFNKYDWFVTLLGLEVEEVYSSYDASDVSKRVFKEDFVWHPTWTQLEKIGAAFKTTKEYENLIKDSKTPAAFSYDSQANLFITLTQQLAARDADKKYGEKGEYAYTRFADNGLGEFTFLKEDNPYAVQAVKYYKQQYDLGHFATSGTLGVDYSSDAFKAEQCIVTIGSSAGAGYNDPGKDGFKVGVATYPQVEGTPENEYQVIQQGTNVTLFTQKDKEVEKYGWLFILHMTNYENATLWATKTAYFPIRKDVLQSEAYQDYLSGKTQAGTDENGNPSFIYEPTLKSKAAAVAWTQNQWFYTNVAFNGSDISRAEIETLVQNVLLTKEGDIDTVIANAFATTKTNLGNYIVE